MPKNILALDLGTKTGWATNICELEGEQYIVNVNHATNSGVQIFDGEISGWKFYAFKQWLDARLSEYQIEHIVYEETFSVSAYASRVLHGFMAMVQYAYAERYPPSIKKANERITLSTVHPMTLKKFATGTGKAKKEHMKKAYENKFGCSLDSFDEVDALWILEYYLKKGVRP